MSKESKLALSYERKYVMFVLIYLGFFTKNENFQLSLFTYKLYFIIIDNLLIFSLVYVL